MNQTDWAYVAGIIDGEGHLSIGCHISDNHKTYNIRPVLAVGNTSKEIVEFCQSVLSGNIYARENHGNYLYYTLQISGLKLRELLEQLLPYLRDKQKRAELILQFINLRRCHRPQTKGYTPEEISLANQIRNMSRKNGHRRRQIRLDSVPIRVTDGLRRPPSLKHHIKPLPKEKLEDLYIKQDLSATKIASMLGNSSASIKRWLSKYNIKKCLTATIGGV